MSGLKVITKRVFDAPREAVWAAFEDPKRLASWWGPNGYSNKFSKFEFRPGGSWLYVMVGPNGHEYQNESRFAEVVKPQRLVVEHVVVPFYRNTMTFTERGGKTELTWNAVIQTDGGEKFEAFIREKNEENFDRLAGNLKAYPNSGGS